MLRIIQTIAVGALAGFLAAGIADAGARTRDHPGASGDKQDSVTADKQASYDETPSVPKASTPGTNENGTSPTHVTSRKVGALQSRKQASSAAHQTETEAFEPATAVPQESPTGQAAYEIPWQSINAGGVRTTGASYEFNCSVGLPAAGISASDNHQVGIGYWWGVFTLSGACACPYQSDYDEDGFLTALDLGWLIDVTFAGTPEIQDQNCPTSRGDFDNDGFPTMLDIAWLIDHLFAGGIGPCDPCAL